MVHAWFTYPCCLHCYMKSLFETIQGKQRCQLMLFYLDHLVTCTQILKIWCHFQIIQKRRSWKTSEVMCFKGLCFSNGNDYSCQATWLHNWRGELVSEFSFPKSFISSSHPCKWCQCLRGNWVFCIFHFLSHYN